MYARTIRLLNSASIQLEEFLRPFWLLRKNHFTLFQTYSNSIHFPFELCRLWERVAIFTAQNSVSDIASIRKRHRFYISEFEAT